LLFRYVAMEASFKMAPNHSSKSLLKAKERNLIEIRSLIQLFFLRFLDIINKKPNVLYEEQNRNYFYKMSGVVRHFNFMLS